MIPWVREEPRSVGEYALAIVQAFTVLCFVWICFAVLAKVGVFPSAHSPRALIFLTDDMLYSNITAPIWEEVVFRGVPLWLVTRLRQSEDFIPGVAVASSLIFGVLHDGGITSIALQGIGGLVFCALYLKCGGLRGAFLAPLTCAIILHMAWNTYVHLVAAIFR